MSGLIVRNATLEEWTKMSVADTAATFFHTPAWYDVWRQYAGYATDVQTFVFDKDRVAVFPLAYKKGLKGFIKRYISSPGGTYGGPLANFTLTAENYREIFGCLCAICNDLNVVANPFCEPPTAAAFPLRLETDAVRLDAALPELFARFSENHKRSVKKAVNYGLRCAPAETSGDWDSFTEIYRQVAQERGKKSTVVYGAEIFRLLRQTPASHRKLWLAYKDDQPVYGCLNFYHNRHAVYWQGAGLPEARNLGAAHFIHYTAMADAVENGFDWYDLGATPAALPDVRRFKTGFGTETKAAGYWKYQSRYGALMAQIQKKWTSGS